MGSSLSRLTMIVRVLSKKIKNKGEPLSPTNSIDFILECFNKENCIRHMLTKLMSYCQRSYVMRNNQSLEKHIIVSIVNICSEEVTFPVTQDDYYMQYL